MTEPPRTFEELMARQADTAHDLSGADRSNWNRRYQLINEPNVRGRTEWNGTLSLSDKHVVQPLQEMYANAGQQHDLTHLKRYCTALKTLLHEDGHVSPRAAPRTGTARRRSRTSLPPERLKGASQSSGHSGTSTATSSGLVSSRLLLASALCVRHGLTPRRDAIAERMAEQSGHSPDEVIRQLNNVHTGQTWEVAAGMMCEADGLATHMPGRDKAKPPRQRA